ncbi:NAD(P)-binding protein [Sparassis latifolia]|uniref:NAD-P-binding protein n=1 Tax=Sparassis crispa TaxID=139825 RepID=A0A401G4W1_9APHY|nr:NAD-P-binding protein [Sparassis crispa]GBE77182.1 NAD-P-binding protein [Sparassis crispa]
MTILITGAAGRTSTFVVRELLQSSSVAPQNLRLLVHSSNAVEKVRAQYPQIPESSFVVGDYLEANTLPPAFEGVDIVFHNAPTFHPLETAMGIAVINAAKTAGVQHFVYCSVLFPILTKLLNHKVKRDVEEYLIESGLNYTILEPTSLMQNFNLNQVRESSTVIAMYSPKVLQGFLDLQDLAEVARLVILDPVPHNRARYELTGQNCTLEDITKEISTRLGRQVVCKPVSREEVLLPKSTLQHAELLSDLAVEGMDRMLYYYDKRGIPGNYNVLRWLLGREPTTWADLLRRDIQCNENGI